MQNMVKSEYFPDIEDSAPLGSDMSATSGLQEAVLEIVLPFIIWQYCLLETKAINPGAWGRAPVLLIRKASFVHDS